MSTSRMYLEWGSRPSSPTFRVGNMRLKIQVHNVNHLSHVLSEVFARSFFFVMFFFFAFMLLYVT